LIRPPESCIGAIDQPTRQSRIERSPLKGRYDDAVDRESAYEILKDRAEEAHAQQEKAQAAKPAKKAARGRQRQSTGEAFVKSAARAIGSQIGRQIMRGILGSLFGGRK